MTVPGGDAGIQTGFSMHKNFRLFLLAGVTASVLALPAMAASKKAVAAPVEDPRIDALEQQLQALQGQLNQIKEDGDYSAQLSDLKRSQNDQYVDINNQLAAQTKASVNNGRLTLTSADGRFSTSLRALLQYDVGYISQSKTAAGPTAGGDLDSGSNFRRAQIGLNGILAGDFSYNFVYDFGGNGTEKNGYIYTAYLEYDGLKPFGFRIGAYAPPAGIEDSTGAADLLFPERPASVDIARGIAGAPGRDALTIFAQDTNYLASISYTGGKAQDGITFDEQQALVGRFAYLAVSTPDVHWLLDVDATHVFKLADSTVGASPTPIGFSNGVEIGFDSSKTVNTGTFAGQSVTQFGLETAANYQNFFVQGGYFNYQIERIAPTPPDPHFEGWYAEAAWSLTGETHAYDPTTASFRGLKPSAALGSGGLGAWELEARYSDIDLNDNPLVAAALGGVAGGKQDVFSVGLNWYPTDITRFSLNYDDINVKHVNAPLTNVKADGFTLRAQLAI